VASYDCISERATAQLCLAYSPGKQCRTTNRDVDRIQSGSDRTHLFWFNQRTDYLFISFSIQFNSIHDQGLFALGGPVVGGIALMILQEWRKGKEIQMNKNTEMKKATRAAKGQGEKEGSRTRQRKFPEAPPTEPTDLLTKKSTVVLNSESDTDLILRLERLDKELSEIREKLMSRSGTEECKNEVISIDKSLILKSEETLETLETPVITPIDMVKAQNSKDATLSLAQSIFLFYKKLDSLTVSECWDGAREFIDYLSRLRITDVMDSGYSMIISIYSFDYLGYFSISLMQFLGRSKEGRIGSGESSPIADIQIQSDSTPPLTSPPNISSSPSMIYTESDLIPVISTGNKTEKLNSEHFKNEIINAAENENENENEKINTDISIENKDSNVDIDIVPGSEYDANTSCSSILKKEEEEE
jgi:hypothetical protein